MHPQLITHPNRRYRFLAGIAPYSCGVIAEPGWEMVRTVLHEPVGWREGFDRVEAYLRSIGQPRDTLCAMELRSPAPFTMDGFIDFNRGYCDVLEQWGVMHQGLNPVARTNVAPLSHPPSEVCLHAFTVVQPSTNSSRPTFIVAGAGELREGHLESDRIVRRGEACETALLEKADYVLEVMENRLAGLGVGWAAVTAIDIYTAHDLSLALRGLLLDRLGPAARNGLCWHLSRPPVVEIEFEMDVRGVRLEQRL